MPPAVALVGMTEVIVGVVGGVGEITKSTGADAPPPPPEPETVTAAVPALATSVEVICACNALALTNVVVRDLPFQLTVELEE